VKRQSNAKSVIPREEKALQYSGEQGSTTDSQKWRIGVCHESRGRREGGVVKKEQAGRGHRAHSTLAHLPGVLGTHGFVFNLLVA